MPVVGIAGVGDKQILATADGFAHARVQLAGGRVVEHQFKFSVLLHAHHAPGGADAVLEVVAQRRDADEGEGAHYQLTSNVALERQTFQTMS